MPMAKDVLKELDVCLVSNHLKQSRLPDEHITEETCC